MCNCSSNNVHHHTRNTKDVNLDNIYYKRTLECEVCEYKRNIKHNSLLSFCTETNPNRLINNFITDLDSKCPKNKW